jgi:hypothetical protein
MPAFHLIGAQGTGACRVAPAVLVWSAALGRPRSHSAKLKYWDCVSRQQLGPRGATDQRLEQVVEVGSC